MPKLPPKTAPKAAGAGLSSGDLLSTRARLEEAEASMKRGQYGSAQTICEDLVARHPGYTGALSLLGRLHFAKGDYPRALSFLLRSEMLNPFDGATLKLLGATYVQLGAGEMAARTLRDVLSAKPGDTEALFAYAEIMRREQEYEIAADGYRKVLAADPLSQAAEIGLAICHMNSGLQGEAARGFEKLLNRGLRSMQVVFNAAQLHAHLPGISWLDLAGEIKREGTEDKGEFDIAIAFLKAAILDRAGRHDEAWQQLVFANRQQFFSLREAWQKQIAYQDASLTRARGSLAKAIGGEPGEGRSAVSLLILGPSRSGKTALEALLASLAHVKRGYESPIIENAVRRAYQSAGFLASRQYWTMPAQVEASCREFYLDELQRRAGGARVFTNSDPDRIHEAAKFAEIIPNVRLAFVKRDPEDLALRIFMKKYAAGNFHAYDLVAIRHYIAWYHQFIDVLAARFPEISCVISYEEMIADPLKIRAAVAQLCGLEATETPLGAPELEDDRNCAAPYLAWMDRDGRS
jgi:tetratricopeptide (TPR) repeat protein